MTNEEGRMNNEELFRKGGAMILAFYRPKPPKIQRIIR